MATSPRSRLFTHSDDAVSFPQGTVLFRAGDPGDYMYILKTGEVDLLVDDAVVETAREGAIFGEFALPDGEQRSSTAIARTAVELVRIDGRRFEFLVQQTPYFAVEVMRTLAARLRQMNERFLSKAPTD